MSTVVAIDGPAGAGKSTVAKKLAERLSLTYVNTGSLYRAIALAAKNSNINLHSIDEKFLNTLSLEYKDGVLLLNGKDPGDSLRTSDIAQGASIVSSQKIVRDYLLPVQRKAAQNNWIVMEGRDIATVVFPDALCKLFVTASIEERARRRLNQSGEIKQNSTIEDVIKEIEERDNRDSQRDIAPLKCAEDSILIDTTGLTIDQVLDKITNILIPIMKNN
jgi:cytidylate kinase